MAKYQMNSISYISLSWQSQLWLLFAKESHWCLIVSWCQQHHLMCYNKLSVTCLQLSTTTTHVYEFLRTKHWCYQEKLTAVVPHCLFRGQVMWRYPVQHGEEVSMGFQDGSRALCSLHGVMPRKSIRGGGVCQRQHHVSQWVRHEAGRLLFGGSPGG